MNTILVKLNGKLELVKDFKKTYKTAIVSGKIQIGQFLYTKDGRKYGNARVNKIRIGAYNPLEPHNPPQHTYTIETCYGNEIILNHRELFQYFFHDGKHNPR